MSLTEEQLREARIRNFLDYMHSRTPLLKYSDGFLESIERDWNKIFSKTKDDK